MSRIHAPRGPTSSVSGVEKEREREREEPTLLALLLCHPRYWRSFLAVSRAISSKRKHREITIVRADSSSGRKVVQPNRTRDTRLLVIDFIRIVNLPRHPVILKPEICSLWPLSIYGKRKIFFFFSSHAIEPTSSRQRMQSYVWASRIFFFFSYFERIIYWEYTVKILERNMKYLRSYST